MQGEVKYVNRGVEHFGTYKIEGRMLELTCRHGTRRAVIGLFEAKVLARKLLRFLVTRADREVARAAPRDPDIAPRAAPAAVDCRETSRPAAWSNVPLVRVAPPDAKRVPAGAAPLA